MSGNRRDLEQLLKRIEKQGWLRIKRRCGHYWLVSPSGARTTCPATPSDHRAILNLRATLRRMGADL